MYSDSHPRQHHALKGPLQKQVVGSSLRTGILILLFNGAMYTLFSPSFNLATNDQW